MRSPEKARPRTSARSAVAARVPGTVGRKPGQTPDPRSVPEQLGDRRGQAAPALGWPQVALHRSAPLLTHFSASFSFS